MAKTKYDASSIEWYEGPTGIRKNVHFYLGTSDDLAVRQLPIEILGNSADEAASGFGNTIVIRVEKNNRVTIWDEGRGLPCGPHPKHKGIDTLQILCTKLHSGGKKSSQAGYEGGTIGTHGLGLAVVNALSTEMQVWTFAKGKVPHTQTYKKGETATKVVRTKAYPIIKYAKRGKGTIIQFTPDFSVFGSRAKLDVVSLLAWVKELSWFAYTNSFSKGKIKKRTPVRFVLIDPKNKVHDIQRKHLSNFYNVELKRLKAEPVGTSDPIVLQTDRCDFVLGWSSHDEEQVYCHVNGVLNPLGGTHHKAVLKLIDTTFRKYAKKSQRYKIGDMLVGGILAINVRLKEPRFDSQSKTRLVSEDAMEIISSELGPLLEKWAKHNAKTIRELIERAVSLSNLNNELKNNKKLAAALKTKSKGKTIYPPKMLVSTTKNPEQRELFLVEGDSALGSAATASDRTFQEILPLRGKLPNMMREGENKKKKSAVEINETIVNILKASGITPADGTSKMRVGKIMFLTDADADGPLEAKTKVHLVDGSKPSIKETYQRFQNGEKLFVWANRKGKFEPAEVKGVAHIVPSTYLRIKLDDGIILRMTNRHRQFVHNGKSIVEKLANQLEVGDSIPCMNLLRRNKLKSFEQMNHKIVSIKEVKNTEEKEFFCLSVPDTGNFYIHAKAGNALLTGNCHISSLLIATLLRFAPDLFDEGKIFYVDTPLYVHQSVSGSKTYAKSYADLREKLGDKISKGLITRAKGLGELNADVLSDVAFNPKTRYTIRLDAEMARNKVQTIMGDNADYRKKMLGV